MLRELGHARPLRQVLTNQSVGVLVGPAFPRVVRCREIEPHAGRALDVLVAVELGAVICGDRVDLVRGVPFDQLDSSHCGLLGGTGAQLADLQEPCLAFDQADDAVLARITDNGVNFPVPDVLTQLDGGRSLGDMAFAGQTSAAVVVPVALASLLASSARC